MKPIDKYSERRPDAENGTVLILALVMLVVLAALATAVSNTSIQEKRMSFNALDQNVSFQAAESALRVGEDYLQGFAASPPTGVPGCTAPCVATSYNALPGNLPWGTAKADAVTTSGSAFGSAKSPPQVIVEDIGRFKTGISSLSSGGGYGGVKVPESQFYRVTALGSGITSDSQAMVQSIYALKY